MPEGATTSRFNFAKVRARFSARPAAKAFAKLPRIDVLITGVSLRFTSFAAGSEESTSWHDEAAADSWHAELAAAVKSTTGTNSVVTVADGGFRLAGTEGNTAGTMQLLAGDASGAGPPTAAISTGTAPEPPSKGGVTGAPGAAGWTLMPYERNRARSLKLLVSNPCPE